MINPTTNHNQFNAPYNILPDVLYTNPTIASSQFSMPLTLGQLATYNIVPDPTLTNPTLNAAAQFTMPISLGQLATYNILPDATYINTTVAAAAQFSTPLTLGQLNTFNYVTTNDVIANPTNGNNQFAPTTPLGNATTFNYTTDNDVIPNPTNGAAQFKPTTPLGNGLTFNYTTDNDILPPANNNVPLNANPQGLAQLSQSLKNPTLQNTTFPYAVEKPGYFINTPLGPDVFISQFAPNGTGLNTNSPIVDPAVGINTNITPKSVSRNILGLAAAALGSISGIPQVAQVGQTALGLIDNESTYLTLAKDRLTRQGISVGLAIKYPDFRARFTFPEKDLFNETNATFQTSNQTIAYFTNRRVDGLAASLRTGIGKKSWKATTYAIAAATPIGPYSIFNLDGLGNTGYGYGDHDNPDAFRNDFTVRSHVATDWKPKTNLKAIAAVSNLLAGKAVVFDAASKIAYGDWEPTKAPQELVVPFRGDRVSVIDFGQRTLKDAYLWKPKRKLDFFDKQSLTQDFIKFYLTGPKLHNGTRNVATPGDAAEDDIIVFRAHITSLDDGFTAGWTGVNYIGRADPSYIYTGMSRDVGVSFDVYATDRDEVKPIWRKLNALAGYTAPTYDAESISMIAPWMRITVGDLFVQAPVTLTSLSYTFGMDTPWEINIEEDPAMMQVPLKISVQMSFNMVGDHLPQKGGRFYTLAKRFDDTGIPIAGNDNWLSDFRDNYHVLAEQLEQQKQRYKQSKKGKIKEKVADNGSSTGTSIDVTGLVTNNAGAIQGLGPSSLG